MSSGPVRRVSPRDIQVVQNLIERCLQLYMNQREVVQTLLTQAKIEPGFTQLVWQKLEEENRDFFNAYYLRLVVKQQISEFNKLLEQQVQLMRQINPTVVAPLPTSNGTRITPMHRNSACYGLERTGLLLKSENMHHQMSSGLPNTSINGGSTLNPNMLPTVEVSANSNRLGFPQNMLSTHSTSMGLMQGLNKQMLVSKAGSSGSSTFMFGADGSALEECPPNADALVAETFRSLESNSQALNNSLLDADDYSYGFLSQLSQNLNFSDLTNDFAQMSEILETYSRSPVIGQDYESFLGSLEIDRQGGGKRLDTISEGVSYKFGSD
ncbi:hypothetical protein K2173_010845 [Erythroxylum novogranatense]|uniref:Uncharacterized protein n=1 Tax=Erythroxylum novogranatense TaxID=1862640 RepID=A0AAV8T1K6_9ROSI|nr:hypothetical protein K2173_010845 [Erythroxylum novogranatense]